MLQLYNLDKEKIEGLTKYKDLKIESTLSTGDKVLSFSYPKKYSRYILEEGYIRTKDIEFVIKQVDKSSDNWVNVSCSLNVEELESMIEDFDSTEQNIESCINFALVGTGWTVDVESSITKRRTVRKTNSSIWDIIQQIKKTYIVEIEFDTINKIVVVKNKIGCDKGAYFSEELNLKSLSVQSNSYDFYTRILAIGKDNLKVEVENYNYSNKRKTLIWKDERYTDENSLREDAALKLEELSKPYRSYSADVIDLAKLNEKYKDILSYKLGDTITLISKENRRREKQRIVKMVEYPDEPERNSCEIANTALTFEDVQKEFQDTSNTVNNITTDNGTVDGSAINGISTEQIYDFESSIGKITDLTVVKAQIADLFATKATIQELNAVIANVGELNATKANITDLNSINAKIENLQATKIEVTDLIATNIKFDVASGGTLDLQTLLSKFVTGENGQFLNITSSNVTIANAVIKDAMVESISVNKLKAGMIDTNKITLSSADGGLSIVGPTMQFKDKSNKVRIQMGQDTQGSFNFILRGEDGTTTLIDHTGIKEKAIADDLIKSNMVAEDAIGEKQINYSSLITGLNKDTNTSLIQASKVAIDLTGQSLEVSFNSLNSNVEGFDDRIESNTTAITVAQGKIDGLISENSIIKGDITTISDKYISLKATVDGINTTVASHTSSIGALNSNVSTMQGSITQLNNKIDLKVEATEVNTIVSNSIDKVEVGGRNLVKETEFKKLWNVFATNRGRISLTDEGQNVEWIAIGQSAMVSPFTEILESGKEYTMSFEARGNLPTMQVFVLSNPTPNIQLNIWKNGLSETEFRKFNFTVTYRHNNPSTQLFLGGISNAVGQWLEIKKCTIKFEEGNKVTDWTPAPEDITSSIDDAESNAINSSKLYTDREITTVNKTITDKVAEIKLTTDSIIQRVSNTESNLATTTSTATTALNNTNNIWSKNYSVNTATILPIKEFNSTDNLNPKYWYEVEGFIEATGTDNGALVIFKGNGTTFEREVIFEKGLNSNHVKLVLSDNGIPSVTLYNHTTKYTVTCRVKRVPRNVSTAVSLQTIKTQVATIETNLSSITQRVSSTESKVSTINGNVSALQTRMTNAEQKITSSAIISTVQATINNAKNDAISSANSSMDSKLQNYATKASMELTANQLKLDFSSSGGYNIVKNGGFKNGLSGWWEGLYNPNGANRSITIQDDTSQWVLDGTNALTMRSTNNTAGEFRVDSQKFKVKRNATYTLSYLVAAHRATQLGHYIRGNEWDVIDSRKYKPNGGGKNRKDWTRIVHTFNTGDNYQISLNFIHFQTGNDAYSWITDVMINEGEMALAWSPHSDEVYSGNTIIDATGVKIYNGALTVLNKSGQVMLQGDSSGNLSFSGRLQPYDYQIRLFGNDCRIDGSAGAIRMQYNPSNYISVDNSYTRFFNRYSAAGSKYGSIGINSEGHLCVFAQTSMLKILNLGGAGVQARNGGDNAYIPITASSFVNASSREYKTSIEDIDLDFIKILKENDIKQYKLKEEVEELNKRMALTGENAEIYASNRIGFILEDLTEEARKYLNPNQTNGIDTYCMTSMIWCVVKELLKRIELLEAKII